MDTKIFNHLVLAIFLTVAFYYMYVLVTDVLFSGGDDLVGVSLLMVIFGLPVFIMSVYGSIKIISRLRSGE